MRVSDKHLADVRANGFTIVEGFVPPDALKAAQDALWQVFPRPADYFADPTKHERIAKSQFSGIRLFPYAQPALNQLAVLPELTDAAERFCGTTNLEIYKIELWAKYAGAVNYDQTHHFDYGNHTIVVPQKAGRHVQMTTFILLSDVTERDAPTKVVPLRETANVPLVPRDQKFGDFFDREIAVTGPAGSLFIYQTHVMHRGSNFTAPERSRFAMLVDFQPRGLAWTGKLAWPDHALSSDWTDALAAMTTRQRDLFGFPPPGSAYWDEQTLRDVAARYPKMDMTPYRDGGG